MARAASTRWRSTVLALGASLSAVAIAGCGKVTPAGADASPAITVGEGCAQEAQAICDALDTCAPFYVQLFFVDKPTCVSRFALSCMADQGGVGTNRTAADLTACAHAVASARCPDLEASLLPAACHVKPGAVVNGANCGSNWQCQSTYCAKRNGACGVCAVRVAEGRDCTADDGCQDGLVCADSKCVVPAGPDQHCDATKLPCRPDLYCRGDGKCAAKVGMGASCTDSDKACDYTKGVACNPFNHICETVKVAKAGGACGIVDRTLTLCVSLGPCPGNTLLTPGVCASLAGDGEACGTAADGRNCLAPATCDMGLCHLPSSGTCQ